ncbi:restriction endonuclease subunit S [Nostoc sp. FACHB-888]|uniref:restriction endonuclease subunit S n=1 Tax=Nostoc sp. FACHB-888 TaxID=2692842 RepID=UPI001685B2EE|nr:restriction endonuclease subunit S [Nostoc sp. FACHB-888]MBD2244166.1 restriction endonuclease subunit S [Nostoc sp. FACHB-888]
MVEKYCGKLMGSWQLLGLVTLNEALTAFEESNEALTGVLKHIDFNRQAGKNRIPDVKLRELSTRKDPNITRDDVVNFLIPLPVLPEQQRITEILDTVDEAIAFEIGL